MIAIYENFIKAVGKSLLRETTDRLLARMNQPGRMMERREWKRGTEFRG
jgi:hypothetical protein